MESQIDARLRLETDVLRNLYKSGALPELMDAIQQRNRFDDYGRFYYLSSSEQGQLAVPQGDWPLRLTTIRTHSTMRLGDVVSLPANSERANLPVRVAETQLADGLTMIIGHEISNEQALLEHTLFLVGGAAVFVLGLALFGGAWMGLTVLKRIDGINQITGEIMSGDLSRRLPVTSRRDEFGQLAVRLNQMLDRIERLMRSMQQVTNNIAHDLRSPLTRMRNKLEVTLLEQRDSYEYRETMAGAIDDADRLINTFNALLSITRLESGIDRTDWREVDISGLVDELADLYQPVAEEKDQVLDWEARPVGLIHANPHLLGQAITNLMDNAIKYTPPGGAVLVTTRQTATEIVVSISDNGPGIPDEDRERVLERFVRLENERSTPGNGLGLSLVQAIARYHGGRLILGGSKPHGLRAELHFPRPDVELDIDIDREAA